MGKETAIAAKDMDALAERLDAAGVRAEFLLTERGMIVRYEDTPQADAYVDQYRLPPERDALDEALS